jgi:hypothetical protein
VVVCERVVVVEKHVAFLEDKAVVGAVQVALLRVHHHDAAKEALRTRCR